MLYKSFISLFMFLAFGSMSHANGYGYANAQASWGSGMWGGQQACNYPSSAGNTINNGDDHTNELESRLDERHDRLRSISKKIRSLETRHKRAADRLDRHFEEEARVQIVQHIEGKMNPNLYVNPCLSQENSIDDDGDYEEKAASFNIDFLWDNWLPKAYAGSPGGCMEVLRGLMENKSLNDKQIVQKMNGAGWDCQRHINVAEELRKIRKSGFVGPPKPSPRRQVQIPPKDTPVLIDPNKATGTAVKQAAPATAKPVQVQPNPAVNPHNGWSQEDYIKRWKADQARKKRRPVQRKKNNKKKKATGPACNKTDGEDVAEIFCNRKRFDKDQANPKADPRYKNCHGDLWRRIAKKDGGIDASVACKTKQITKSRSTKSSCMKRLKRFMDANKELDKLNNDKIALEESIEDLQTDLAEYKEDLQFDDRYRRRTEAKGPCWSCLSSSEQLFRGLNAAGQVFGGIMGYRALEDVREKETLLGWPPTNNSMYVGQLAGQAFGGAMSALMGRGYYGCAGSGRGGYGPMGPNGYGPGMSYGPMNGQSSVFNGYPPGMFPQGPGAGMYQGAMGPYGWAQGGNPWGNPRWGANVNMGWGNGGGGPWGGGPQWGGGNGGGLWGGGPQWGGGNGGGPWGGGPWGGGNGGGPWGGGPQWGGGNGGSPWGGGGPYSPQWGVNNGQYGPNGQATINYERQMEYHRQQLQIQQQNHQKTMQMQELLGQMSKFQSQINKLSGEIKGTGGYGYYGGGGGGYGYGAGYGYGGGGYYNGGGNGFNFSIGGGYYSGGPAGPSFPSPNQPVSTPGINPVAPGR